MFCELQKRTTDKWSSHGRRWEKMVFLASTCSMSCNPFCILGSCRPVSSLISSHWSSSVYSWATKYYSNFTINLLIRNGASLKSLVAQHFSPHLSLSILGRIILLMGSCSQYFLKFLSLQPLGLAFAEIFTLFLLFWYQYLIQSTCHCTCTIPKTLIWDERDKWTGYVFVAAKYPCYIYWLFKLCLGSSMHLYEACQTMLNQLSLIPLPVVIFTCN